MKLRGLKNQAWVTAAVTDEDAKCSIVLANSLKRVLSNRNVVIFVSGRVASYWRERLHNEFDHVYILEEDRNLANLEQKDYAKLTALTLKSFQKCIFVLPKMMFLKNADEIFDQFEDSVFACPQYDASMSIFAFKPSMESYNALTKALCCRNGLPVSTYLQNWFKNQYNNKEYRFLEPKYNKCIYLRKEAKRTPNTTDTVIVNFIDDPISCKDWEDESVAHLNLIDYHAIKIWLELYNQHVSDNLQKNEAVPATPLKEIEYAQEPVAIIGMSCRYPGCNNLEEFWNLLANGEDGTGNPPPFRWLREQCSRNRPDCMKTNAGFLKVPIDEFDAKFFGISPKEVLYMDPQHRLLHELIWEGLEDAAIDPLKLRGSNGGVFMGSWTNDFKDILDHAGVSEFYRTYMGNSIGAAAARISFMLGLTGPSLATESGCSSAMVAVHQACRSLQQEETNLALACGVNLLLHPFDKDEMPMVISPDGRCKTFDSKADGFSRAEGCGVLVLKRLSDAVKDNDHIWGLIRGSGVSQEGVSRSLGTPTVQCEALAMQQALREADVEPHEVSYVEAHGTGTVVGDPMEVAAISKAYHSKARKEPLVIGSVKTNVGHTESCSGITGIMKVILAMRNEVIPKHRNFETLNPNINLDMVPAIIPVEPQAWKKYDDGRRRIAGVSSFGITGTDAHVIVEEPPEVHSNELMVTQDRPQHILTVSARTEEALNILLEQYAENIENSNNTLADIAHTANIGRASFPWRAAITAKTKEEVVNKLRQHQSLTQEVYTDTGKKVCFLFTGQGSQYFGMAKKLYETNAVFQIHFDYCDGLLKDLYNINIKDILWRESQDKSEVSRTIYSQTSIFCVEYALLKLWESWGVKPDYVLGHSLGEFAAAVCAGILSVEDALKLVAERSILIDELPCGKMLVVKADKNAVEQVMTSFSQGDPAKLLDYAAINSSQQTVVAGDSAVVLAFAKYCTDENNLKCIILEATHAFHSNHMDPMLDKYRKVASSIQGNENQNCEYISGMRGSLMEAGTVNAEYWVDHTRQPVKFLDASKIAVQLGCNIFIEIGPQPVLSALTLMNNDGTNLTCLPSLKKTESEWDTLLETLAKLHLTGVSIDWEGFDKFYCRNKVRLPHYPFIGKKFWPDMLAVTGNAIHPLLGSLIPNASETKIFQNGLNLRCLEYVKDHAIGQTAIFPGAGYLEMALAAGHAVAECCTDSMNKPSRPMKVENLTIAAPLALEESKTSQVQVVVDFINTTGIKETGDGDWNNLSIKIFHRLGAKWLQHASAVFTPLPSAEEINSIDFDLNKFHELRTQPSDDITIVQMYEKLASVGLKFGPTFQSLEKIWRDGKIMVAKVKIPADETLQYILHPVIIDCMIQAVMVHKHSDKIKRRLYVPISISKFIWYSNSLGEELYIYTEDVDGQPNQAVLINELGIVVGVMSGIELIDTTVKAVDSVLEQQTSTLPDLWEENWRGKPGPMHQRIPDNVICDPGFTNEFKQCMERTYNIVPEDKENTFRKLEEYVYYWVLNGLYVCGWVPKIGDSFDVTQLVQQLGIEEVHTKLVNYFMEIMEQEGIVKSNQGSWDVISSPPSPETLNSLLIDPVFTDELVKKFDPTRLIKEVGENLANILKGSQSPLQVLFPEDTTNKPSVSKFYDDYGSVFNVADSISDAQRQRLTSWQKKMENRENFIFRIIEVGAGTGIFTSIVLPVIAELGVKMEYTFTDISPAFFSLAEKRFEKYSNCMVFKRLNIEEDPISQGFRPEYYDYAIASDVIHATKDVSESLRNIRKLLRTGGNFEIMEQIQKNRIISFIFGITQGFWGFQDFRTDHCILTAPAWTESLKQSGFGKVELFPSFNGRHGLISSLALESHTMLHAARKSSNTAWIIFSQPDCKLSNFLSKKLETSDRCVIHIESDNKFQEISPSHFKLRGYCKLDFEKLMIHLKAKNITVEGIIYLWGLDKNRTQQKEILQPYFYISQTLFSLKQKIMPKLCAVTEGVAPVGESDLSHVYPSTLWGFTKSFRNENLDINCRCISVQNDDQSLSEMEMSEVFHEIWSQDKESQVAYYNGNRYVARFQSLKVTHQELSLPSGTNRFELVLPETKSIEDLQFGPLEPFILGEGEIEIQVKTSALNFRDVFNVLKPTEQFKDSNAVGFDFAGVIKRVGPKVSMWSVGDHVFGLNVNGGALPSHIKLNENDVIPKPMDMTFCDACTLPAVVATSYHCLIDVAKITENDRVLIHTASGGVGLSAIEICKSKGATIFATAGNKRKRNYLKSLGIKHVFNSRNTEYGHEILEVTNGQGVNVVVNSLTSEGFKEATLKACAKGARFVEMSKLSIWQPEEVQQLRPDVQYTIVDVSSMNATELRRLMTIVKELVDAKIVSPISYVRYDGLYVREALKYLQKAKHIGKVVIQMPEIRQQGGTSEVYISMFNENATYLITGGLGGIGFEVAKWMVRKGAKNILLGSRKEPSKSVQAIIDELNSKGANLIPVRLDVGDYDQCKELIQKITDPTGLNLNKLRGIMHCAGTLNDALIVNQDWEKLSSTFNSKIKGTLNLHELTLGYPLECFVLFSSIVALYGSPGQANHAAGNCFEDAFAHYRHSVGLCATTVNWGQWGEIGIAVEVELPGMKAISTLQGISALEYVMKTQRIQTSVMNMESFVLFTKMSPQLANYLDERIWKTSGSSTTSMTIKSDEFWQQYDSKNEKSEKSSLLKCQLKDILRKILKMDNEEPIEDDANFQEMGVDSLMFIEIKNAVQSLLGDRITISANSLRDCNNTTLLSEQLTKLIEGEDVPNELEVPPTTEEVIALLREDCILPEKITTVGRPHKNISDISTILLTGATGNLGPYILKELSKMTQISTIYILTRPSKSTTLQERLENVLKFRDLTEDVNLEKIKYVKGNITKPKLGVDDNEWAELVQNVDAVFHIAVKAHHTQHYRKRDNGEEEDVRAVNIEGTKNILEFACSSQDFVKHVFCASSLLSVATTEEDGTLSESWPNIGDFDGVSPFAYPNSKFVCDVLMRISAERNIPTKVFRLPLIAGDSKTGKFNVEQNHMILRYLYLMKSGIMPSNPFPMVMLPVDQCASIATKLFFHPQLSSQPSDIYNITHHQPDLDQEFVNLSSECFGCPLEIVDFSEFANKLFSEPDGSTFSMFKEMYRDEDELMSVYTVAKSLRKWLEGVENFWISKKISYAEPEFYNGLERTIHTLKRDLEYAKNEGWFEKFGVRTN